MITFRLASRMSSILSKPTLAEQGPTRFMLSMLAAIRAVLMRSRLVGIIMLPVVRSFFERRSISILARLPVQCAGIVSLKQIRQRSAGENCAEI